MFAPSSKLSAPSPRPSIGAADVSPQSTRLGDTPRLPAWHLPSWTDIAGAQDSRLYGAPRCCRNASRRSNLALRASNLACSAFKLAYSFFSAAYCARNLAISRSASSCWSSSGASISPLSQIRARRARALTRPVSIGHRLGSHQKTRLCHKITSVDNSRRIISSICGKQASGTSWKPISPSVARSAWPSICDFRRQGARCAEVTPGSRSR
jgi:hypothetical protein